MSAIALHARLLELHKALLDVVRADYEREHGVVRSAGELLQLVIGDAAFAWLRPLSALLVELDDTEALARAGGPRALTELVFRPGNLFYDRLLEVLQSTPSVVLPHAEAMRALKSLPDESNRSVL
jgi:hypothetical protein